jgi:hypothetical protein
VTIGCSCNKNTPTGALLDGLGFGYLQHVPASGNSKAIVDLAAYEASVNPDGAQIDSNPFGLLALPGHQVATDAGGNSLLNVAANGHVSTIATFPRLQTPFPRDAVPTAVVLGPDGAYYVPTLTGFPFTAGTAAVYRVVPGQAPTVYASNLTMLTDLAFAADGSLYVLEHASGIGRSLPFAGPGSLRKVPWRRRTSTLVAGGCPRHGSVIGDDGVLYVSATVPPPATAPCCASSPDTRCGQAKPLLGGASPPSSRLSMS